MTTTRWIVLAAGITAAAVPARAQDAPRRLDLRFDQHGDVWLRAQQVSLREVMAEWARQCRCRIVNADRLSAAPTAVPLAFEGQPQAQVLEALLRQVPGYVLTPRRDPAAGPSMFETIYVVAESTAMAGGAPVVPPPAPRMLSTPGSPDDEIPPVRPLPIQAPAAGAPAADAPKPAAGPTDAPASPIPTPRPAGVSVPAVRIVPVTR